MLEDHPKGRPVIMSLNLGTTMKGAVDDLDGVLKALEDNGIKDYYIHYDGALFGMMLPFIKGAPEINFLKKIDSVAISGHKPFGTAQTGGILLCRKSRDFKEQDERAQYYIDNFLSQGDNGLLPLFFWVAARHRGISGFKKETWECLKNANYLYDRLTAIGYPCGLNPFSNTVLFKRPPQKLIKKWGLAPYGAFAHIVVMQDVKKENIDAFVDELEAEDRTGYNQAWKWEFSEESQEELDAMNHSHKIERKIQEMSIAAEEAGKQIPTNIPDGRYELIVDYGLHDDEDEYKADIRGYELEHGGHIGAGDRFDLTRANTSDVENILAHVKNPESTIVQVSGELAENDVLKLKKKAPGIRVIRVDTPGLMDEDNDSVRRHHRFDLYAMMLAARKITDNDIKRTTSIYRVLQFFVNTHYKDGDEDIASAFIHALVNNELAVVIKYNLSFCPAGPWAKPGYHTIADTLVSA